jgi:hypothetical protein
VPTVEFPPAFPFTSQLTEVLLVPEMLAENCCVLPSWTIALVGVTAIATGLADDEIDTVALADTD